jgi:endonuclease III
VSQPDPASIANALLKRFGRTLSEELGFDAELNTPSGLFQLLCTALLASARIGHTIALAAAKSLFEHGWTTPEKLARSTWEQRVKALDEAGYARYDERTSTMLGETAQMVIERYQGDLRNLRENAGRKPDRERKLLKEFKGIGDVGVDIFFREVQTVWTELFPFADSRVLESAKKLGLPPDARALADLVRGKRRFAQLVAALVRVQLERTHVEILEELAA